MLKSKENWRWLPWRGSPTSLSAPSAAVSGQMSDYDLFEAIGRRRGFLISGGEVNTERTANTLLDEFRAAKIGRITLDQLPKGV